MVWLQWWHPSIFGLVIACASCAVHAACLRDLSRSVQGAHA
jgi:hypothetical protein